ncbi:MAG: hypothetical protein AB1656_25260 [Candidatus Omnitrophota bacterium]
MNPPFWEMDNPSSQTRLIPPLPLSLRLAFFHLLDMMEKVRGSVNVKKGCSRSDAKV